MPTPDRTSRSTTSARSAVRTICAASASSASATRTSCCCRRSTAGRSSPRLTARSSTTPAGSRRDSRILASTISNPTTASASGSARGTACSSASKARSAAAAASTSFSGLAMSSNRKSVVLSGRKSGRAARTFTVRVAVILIALASAMRGRRAAVLSRRSDPGRSRRPVRRERGEADRRQQRLRLRRAHVPQARRSPRDPRRQRQHDGRGARLELVHQPDRTAGDGDRRDRPRTQLDGNRRHRRLADRAATRRRASRPATG